MLRDITIGQHFPGDSVLHRMDPRAKLLLTIVYIVMLFVGVESCGPRLFPSLFLAAAVPCVQDAAAS